MAFGPSPTSRRDGFDLGCHLLRAIDAAKQAMRATVELPDARENLFIRVCMQSFQAGHGYRLSPAKRRLFDDLSDNEIAALEQPVRPLFDWA